MRALGLDYGLKRIGVALSDPTGTIATPMPAVRRRTGRRPPVASLARIGQEHGVSHVVAGLPLTLAGEENDWCAEVRRVASAVADRIGAEVAYVDERLSSVRAQAAVRAVGLPRKKRKSRERVDTAAAQLILQAWLDRRTLER